MAAQVMHNLIQLIATVSTAAKLGSTAAYSHADFVMVELGAAQPRNLAEAFREPAQPTLRDTLNKLSEYVAGRDRMTGRIARQHIAVIDAELPGSTARQTVDDLARWVHRSILQGEVA